MSLHKDRRFFVDGTTGVCYPHISSYLLNKRLCTWWKMQTYADVTTSITIRISHASVKPGLKICCFLSLLPPFIHLTPSSYPLNLSSHYMWNICNVTDLETPESVVLIASSLCTYVSVIHYPFIHNHSPIFSCFWSISPCYIVCFFSPLHPSMIVLVPLFLPAAHLFPPSSTSSSLPASLLP